MQKFKNLRIAIVIIGYLILLGILVFLIYPHFLISNFNDNLEIEIKGVYKEASGNICYGNFFKCHDVSIKKEGDVDTEKIGEYKVIYTFSYDNKSINKEQIVKVVDKTAPTLDVKGDKFVYCPNGNTLKYDYVATDNYDGDLTSKVVVTAEDNKLLFSVKDSSNNEIKIFKDAQKIDEEAPVITLNGDKEKYLLINSEYSEEGASATDNCDGDLTSKIEVVGSVDKSKVGEYKITYKVTDSSMLSSEVTRTVYVYNTNNYNAPSGKNIYLTFDDGPGAYTSKLLDVLKKYNVKVTFFVTDQGFTRGYDDVIKRAYDEGHTIGLHSNTHSYEYIYSSVDNYFSDLNAIQYKVEKITGYKSKIVRLPGGSSNTISKNYDGGTRIMSKITEKLNALGYRYFDWNVSSGDAGETTSTSGVVSNVINSLGSGSAYVILQHDIKEFSVNAVEQIIEYGLSHGYTFRPLTMDSPTIHHRINN